MYLFFCVFLFVLNLAATLPSLYSLTLLPHPTVSRSVNENKYCTNYRTVLGLESDNHHDKKKTQHNTTRAKYNPQSGARALPNRVYGRRPDRGSSNSNKNAVLLLYNSNTTVLLALDRGSIFVVPSQRDTHKNHPCPPLPSLHPTTQQPTCPSNRHRAARRPRNRNRPMTALRLCTNALLDDPPPAAPAAQELEPPTIPPSSPPSPGRRSGGSGAGNSPDCGARNPSASPKPSLSTHIGS